MYLKAHPASDLCGVGFPWSNPSPDTAALPVLDREAEAATASAFDFQWTTVLQLTTATLAQSRHRQTVLFLSRGLRHRDKGNTTAICFTSSDHEPLLCWDASGQVRQARS